MGLLTRFFSRTASTPTPTGDQPRTVAPVVPPTMVSLAKAAGVSLQKRGLSSQRAAVYLVLDHSMSMKRLYASGAVQHLAEQALGLSAQLDDDGTVPVILFHSTAYPPVDVQIGDHLGAVDRIRKSVGAKWGGTSYAPALKAVIKHYQASGASDPAFVIFQTDGACGDRAAVERELRAAASLPIFWQFVGFGAPQSREFAFLRRLDELTGRVVDNAGFCATGKDPLAMSDVDLYDELLNEFPAWLIAARAAGVLG